MKMAPLTIAVSVIGALASLVLALASLLVARAFSSIDNLWKYKADKEATNQRHDELMVRVDRHLDDDRVMHQQLAAQLGQLNAGLARIEGAIKARESRGEDDEG